MIFKTLPRHSASFHSTIKYIVDASKAKDVITHNLRSENIEGWTKELLVNESYRNITRSDQVYFYHDILSFSPDDKGKIKKEMLQDIANQYIQLRGREGMYVGAIHEDKDHTHIHLLTSGLEYRTGKAFWIQKQELQNLKLRLQEYYLQKFPELSKSAIAHGKAKQQWRERDKEQRSLLKAEIGEKVKLAFEHSHSQKEFLETLRSEGMHHYERNGVATGIMIEDTKFRFSRLDISKDRFDELPPDNLEEKIALEEINSLRENRSERNRNDRFETENDYDNCEIEDEEIGR